MNFNDTVKMAKSLGIKPRKLKKIDLIHEIQKAEHNYPCYGTTNGDCDQLACLWRDDCLKIAHVTKISPDAPTKKAIRKI